MEARFVHFKLGLGEAGVTRQTQCLGTSKLSLLQLDDALRFLETGLTTYPSIQDLALILQRCAAQRHRAHALRLHAFMLQTGLETHQLLGNYLVPLLANVGNLHDAQLVFNRIAHRNGYCWNSLISGFIKCDKPYHALTLYERMRQDDSVQPDGHTFVTVFKACAELKDLERGCRLHIEVARLGLLERILVVGNALIDMYAKCGALSKAEQVFESLPRKNVVTWTSLLQGYVECGHGEEALECFEEMQLRCVTPNPITFVCSLKACTITGDIVKGQEFHAEIERRGLLADDVFIASALVNMYAKHGLLAIAQQVFDRLPRRNVVSWNSLMSGYSEHKCGEEAVKFFERMQSEDVCLTDISLLCGLKACGSIGAVDKIGEIHAEIDRRDLLKRDLLVGSTLVNIYAKCGCLAKAQQVFDSLPAHDVVSWTSLLVGYAQLGESKTATHFFDRMLGAGVKPDPVAFVVLLNACSRTGLFDKSETYFHIMSKVHGIAPILEHHSCMLDLLGRVGELERAWALLGQMPCDPNLAVWHTVLGSCERLGNAELGKRAFQHAVRLDSTDSAAYTLICHICAATDLHKGVNNHDG